MWVSLFAVVLAISLGLALGAVMLESYGEETLSGRRPVRTFRPMRMRN